MCDGELLDPFVVLRGSEAFQGAGDVDQAVHLLRLRGGAGARTSSRLVWSGLRF